MSTVTGVVGGESTAAAALVSPPAHPSDTVQNSTDTACDRIGYHTRPRVRESTGGMARDILVPPWSGCVRLIHQF